MKALSYFDEVVQDLEQHENALRIKKIFFCACKNIWENDPNTLQKYSLHSLIKELHELNPTLTQLKSTLDNIVKGLNKQSDYTKIMESLISKLEKLYIDSEETQFIAPNLSNITPTLTSQSPQETPENPQQRSKSQRVKYAYDKFELRMEIMKYTSPLRAKILIFSILYHPFDFSAEDWLTLKTRDLDNLLFKLFQENENVTELESKLYERANNLREPDENLQAAGVILQVMRRYYGQEKSLDVSSQTNVKNAPYLEDEEESTCQIYPTSKNNLD